MKRFPVMGVLLLIPALALVLLTGCPATPPAPSPSPPVKPGGDKGDGGKAEKITAPTDGAVTGVVKFDGDAPKGAVVVKKDHSDAKECLAGGGNHTIDQQWLVDSKGGVANVVISLVPAEGKEYDISAAIKDKWKKNAAVLDQPFCAYIPHALPIYADVQPLLIKNSAKVVHNVKIDGGIKNRDTSDNMEPGKVIDRGTFKFVPNPIPVACTAHTWMTAKIITFNHPYFAVTKEDGSFEIGDVPSGVELRVFMWHESMDKAMQVGKVTAKAGAKTSVDNLKIK